MNNNAHDKAAQEERSADVFARLHEQDIEQFYAHYQLWVLRRRLPMIEKQIEALQEHIAENQQTLESLRPSALALAVLVRLQSNGVNDTDVLDLMLDRGESWLDRMMQRLDYCEQVEDFIQGDYTLWCIRSLEGAYDWIDSLLGSIKENDGQQTSARNESIATEELLLQKLSLDDEEAMLQVTLKQPTLQPEQILTDDHETNAANVQPAEPESILIPAETQAETQKILETEQIPLAASNSKQQESSEAESVPELIGWKDLEDLEAPEGHPVPWYSVNVTESGSSSTEADTEQASGIDEWITVLQAENMILEEASETLEIEPGTETAGAVSEIEADIAAFAETPEAEPDRQAASEVKATALVEEELIALANTELISEQDGSSLSEVLDESSLSLEERELEAMPATEVSSEENTMPQLENLDEALVSAANVFDTLSKAIIHHENETEQVEIPADEDKQALGASDFTGEKREINSTEQEVQRLDLEEAKITGNEAEETSDLKATEITSGEDEGTPGLKATEITSGEDEGTPGRNNAVESEETPVFVAEVILASDEHTEETTPEVSSTQTHEHTEMATPEVADEQAVLNIGEQRSETAKAVLEQEDDKAEWGSEIESAAVLNDIPDIEGEQEEQMAWYEYLELEEPANDATRPENAEQSRPEEVSSAGSAPDVIASETGTPENYEHTTPNEPVTTLPLVGEERTDEPATALPLESGATEGSNEIQDWQIWQAQGTGDETLPLALKEIQFAQQQQNSIAHEESVSETTTRGEEIARDEQNAVEAEVSAIFEASSANLVAKGSEMPVVYTAEIRETQSPLRANEQGALTNSEAEPPAKSQTPQWSELVETLQAHSETTSIFAETIAINEESTTILDEQQAVSSAEDRVETLIEQVVVHTQAEAMLPVQPLVVSAPPPKKPGFWRRLFSFGRKNR